MLYLSNDLKCTMFKKIRNRAHGVIWQWGPQGVSWRTLVDQEDNQGYSCKIRRFYDTEKLWKKVLEGLSEPRGLECISRICWQGQIEEERNWIPCASALHNAQTFITKDKKQGEQKGKSMKCCYWKLLLVLFEYRFSSFDVNIRYEVDNKMPCSQIEIGSNFIELTGSKILSLEMKDSDLCT